MKKNIIKLLYFNLLTIILIFITKNYNSYAASDFTYTVENNVATITSYNGTSGNVVIPNKIGKYKVTAIGNHAFDENRKATNGRKMVNVVISEGITKIGDFAFVDCTNLVNIKLPNSLSDLGDQTFTGCTNLKKINIPPKVKRLGITGYMFQECGLESIIIPANVITIPDATFRLCRQLKKVTIYSPKTVINPNAFEYCSKYLVIQGYNNSTAQTFAKQNGCIFDPITKKKSSANVPVKSIKLSQTYITLKKGSAHTIKPYIFPVDATNQNVRWASSNPEIVTVKNGTLFGKNVGKVKIAVATVDGNYKAFTNVTVVEEIATEKKPDVLDDIISNDDSDKEDSNEEDADEKESDEDADKKESDDTVRSSNEPSNDANSSTTTKKKATTKKDASTYSIVNNLSIILVKVFSVIVAVVFLLRIIKIFKIFNGQ